MLDFKKPKRKVEKVFIHCSDSDNLNHDNIETIYKWHVKENKWKDIGYHFFINKNGELFAGRDIEVIPSSQKSYNTGSISICLSGKTFFTEKQFKTLKNLCNKINVSYNKNITFHGHKEVNKNKTCPNFDYKNILNLNKNGYIEKKTQKQETFMDLLIILIKKMLKK